MPARALIFDSLYNDHKGILAYVRVFDGEFRAGGVTVKEGDFSLWKGQQAE